MDSASHANVLDYNHHTDSFLDDVLEGLTSQPKTVPCKYLYDERGSQLFDDICELQEYYPTRTEAAIMSRYAGPMANELGPGCMLIEYGSGTGAKTRSLLQQVARPTAYVPVDISIEVLSASSVERRCEFPDIEVLPVCADFTRRFDLPEPRHAVRRRVVYFPGSTIGNFTPEASLELLRGIVRRCGPGGGLLVGIDLRKDVSTLEAAYNDCLGVTAEFNKNVLVRINRELDGTFALHRFRHRAVYNQRARRIEMHLVSLEEQTVLVDGTPIRLEQHETICTEHSHKYDIDEFSQLARRAGLRLERSWTDERDYFAVLYLEVV